ncbi:hypothetical protein [Rhodococcus globerulus]|uniref:Uncharacterized protein n=1 Tax=Rhodococcus globerulus TaxID=33008 RepID=A0ABU4C4A4_RHOGO|nr:hypothetical protein [Rhodococcus globerulus]MDV6271333.1 hypothetical protein [Rhodococcus globerulus]
MSSVGTPPARSYRQQGTDLIRGPCRAAGGYFGDVRQSEYVGNRFGLHWVGIALQVRDGYGWFDAVLLAS